MDLIPKIDIYAGDKLEKDNISSKVHLIKDTQTLDNQVIDNLDSVKQACFCILATQQGIHKIYDDSYGLQTFDLIGKDYSYIASELKRRIIEALKRDERIEEVKDFVIKKVKNDSIHLAFVVQSIYGNISTDKTIKVVEGDS